ncbi:MAG: hypothetical protein WC307_04500 [Candidatus Nanoarchaeia archaeon]|jgi:hypothetical protein
MSNGLVVREGSIDLKKARVYASRQRIPFIDLRDGLSYSNIDQLNQCLSVRISNVFRRPIRVSINSFFKGECLGNNFVAILPHDFVNDFMVTTKRMPGSIITDLNYNEAILA